MKGKRSINALIGVLAIVLIATSLFPNTVSSFTSKGSNKNQLVIKNVDCHSNSQNSPCEPNEKEEESDFETKPFFLHPGGNLTSYAFMLPWNTPTAIPFDADLIASPLPIYLVTRSLLI